MFFPGKTAVIDYEISQGSTKLTVPGFVQDDYAWVCP